MTSWLQQYDPDWGGPHGRHPGGEANRKARRGPCARRGTMARPRRTTMERCRQAEAERDRYRDALAALVAAVDEVRTLENREYETDEYDDGLQAAIAGALHRRNAAEKAARALLGNGAGAEAAEQ